METITQMHNISYMSPCSIGRLVTVEYTNTAENS